MSPLTQSKLLRVLQEQRFERVGGNETIRDGRARDRRHQPRPGGTGRRGAVPPGPVLPPERLHDLAAAAARTRRGPAAAGGTLPAPLQPGAGQGRATWTRRRRWTCCGATPGRATCASCRACSSRRCCRPRAGAAAGVPAGLPEDADRRTAEGAAPRPGLAGRFIDERLAAGEEDLYAEAVQMMERQLLTARAAAHGRQPAAGGPDAGHHPRQPAEQDARAGHHHRADRGRRRRDGGNGVMVHQSSVGASAKR